MSRGPHKEPQKYARRRVLTTADESLIDRMPAFAALAQKHGYSPSEFLIIRRMEMFEEEQVYKEQMESGENEALYQTTQRSRTPYMASGDHNVAKKLEQVQREGIAIDLQLMAYEKPKLRSMEVSMTVEEKTVADYLREANERRREIDS